MIKIEIRLLEQFKMGCKKNIEMNCIPRIGESLCFKMPDPKDDVWLEIEDVQYKFGYEEKEDVVLWLQDKECWSDPEEAEEITVNDLINYHGFVQG